MLHVRFQGVEYLFVGDSLAEGGALATPAAYAAGTASYAHLFADGTVRCFCEVIGHRDDIEVLGMVDEPEADDDFFLNLLTDPGWQPPHGHG